MDSQATTSVEEADPFAALAKMFAGRRPLLREDDAALADHVSERLVKAGFAAVDRFDAGEAALAATTGLPYNPAL